MKVRGTVHPIKQSAAGAKERRKYPRHKLDTSAVLRLIDIAKEIHGRIVDLSLGGCRIRIEQRFPLGIYRRVEIEFRLDGIPVRLGGVTQSIHDPFNIGIRFVDISERKREQLVQLIEEIKELRERERARGSDYDPG